jgi:hypothetical protein
VDDAILFAGAVPLARDGQALATAFGRTRAGDADSVPSQDPQLGDVEQFWVLSRASGTFEQVAAELRYVGPVLLMYVDTSLQIDQNLLERAAADFEERIYPRNRALFGSEPSPGIDGDPRLTVLNTNLSGVGGYFSSADAVARGANRFSNQREMFVVGVNSFPVGTPLYSATLAHEFQHMIAWNQQRRRPAWLDEGLASLAEDLNGYVDHAGAIAYLASPDLQLTTWSSSGRHYGMSRLFARYFHEQYAGDEGLSELSATDAGNNPEMFASIAARKRPDISSFSELFADWTVANLINDRAVGDGRFAYTLLPGRVDTTPPQPAADTTVSQFGADYIGTLDGPLTLTFDGAETVPLAGPQPAEGVYAWWSNRGDESVSTLTRSFDLTGLERATLRFRLWHEIERHFDYAFVTASTDGGTSWQTLPGRTTTEEDPQGQSLGHAFTGVSGTPGQEIGAGLRGTWLDEEVDLSPYAGRSVQLRFWLVSDAAINGPGMLIDDIQIPELGYRDAAESGDGGWDAVGFVRTIGDLAQQWELRLVRFVGTATSVEPVAVDERGRATISVSDGERAVLVVSGATPLTTEPAAYSYWVTSP